MNESSQPQQRLGTSTAVISALALLICIFGNLGSIGLVGPDEPRYGWIARAMAATGDWVTPRLYGQPWFEKPILYYWTAAFGFSLHLPAEWALRLPSALAALAAAIAIGWLAWSHYGHGPTLATSPALLAPVLFSTTVAAIGFARAATPDMLFSACLALSMSSAACALRSRGALRAVNTDSTVPSRDTLAIVLFGAFLGLAVLAKGPAAIVLAGGAIAIWALATNRWRIALRVAHPYSAIAFCVIALPWYVLCALRNPDFLRIFILQHNFERYLTPLFQHRQPFWFFGPIVLLSLLPWTVLLWPAAQEGLLLWRNKSWRDSPGFFFTCWALFPILFFSFSESKLPGYILPAIPPLALLCAVSLVRITGRKKTTTFAALGIALALTWIGLGLSAGHWTSRLPPLAHDAVGHSISIAAATAVAGGVAIAVLAFFRRRAFVALSVLLVVSMVEIAGWRILPSLDPYISARSHGELLHNDLHPDRIFTYHLPRSWSYGLAFYLGRELPEWSPTDPNSALILTTPKGLKDIQMLHRFYGSLDEQYKGVLYVPVGPTPQSR
ncbi:MAG TPA: phospholipid carrier-dependent glycosyltransferase [Candidatus Acidoferrales bacterium]|nr:phospholipid carrier-dependent glycosyltransferase [Candidatus Acidoferrales bacterium]